MKDSVMSDYPSSNGGQLEVTEQVFLFFFVCVLSIQTCFMLLYPRTTYSDLVVTLKPHMGGPAGNKIPSDDQVNAGLNLLS